MHDSDRDIGGESQVRWRHAHPLFVTRRASDPSKIAPIVALKRTRIVCA
jgi:hypothetical protein